MDIRKGTVQPNRTDEQPAPQDRSSAPIEPKPESILDQMEVVARHAVLLRRPGLPVAGSHEARSFFGGLPRLPPHLAWPDSGTPEDPAPMMFAAQIDLAEAALAESPLPGSGTLYFFFHSNDWVEEDWVQVLYYDGAGNEFPERELPAARNSYPESRWPWLDEHDVMVRAGFKYPIRFVTFTSYPDEEIHFGALTARLAHEVSDPVPPLDEAIRSAGAAWPFVWSVIEHSTRGLCHAIDGLDYALRKKPAETVAEFKRIRELASACLQRCADHSSLEACDETTQQHFNDEWSALSQAIEATRVSGCSPNVIQWSAVRLVCNICASRSQETLALIPESFRRAIENEPLWVPQSKWQYGNPNPIHQMLGYGTYVQGATVTHAEDVMLLQLMGDGGFDWHSNIGCTLQFWITPNALAERDFDGVKITFECD